MANRQLAQNLFQAVSSILDKKIDNLTYDQTKQGVVKEISSTSPNSYLIDVEGIEYTIACTDYQLAIGEGVWVLFPANPTDPKTIIGRTVPTAVEIEGDGNNFLSYITPRLGVSSENIVAAEGFAEISLTSAELPYLQQLVDGIVIDLNVQLKEPVADNEDYGVNLIVELIDGRVISQQRAKQNMVGTVNSLIVATAQEFHFSFQSNNITAQNIKGVKLRLYNNTHTIVTFTNIFIQGVVDHSSDTEDFIRVLRMRDNTTTDDVAIFQYYSQLLQGFKDMNDADWELLCSPYADLEQRWWVAPKGGLVNSSVDIQALYQVGNLTYNKRAWEYYNFLQIASNGVVIVLLWYEEDPNIIKMKLNNSDNQLRISGVNTSRATYTWYKDEVILDEITMNLCSIEAPFNSYECRVVYSDGTGLYPQLTAIRTYTNSNYITDRTVLLEKISYANSISKTEQPEEFSTTMSILPSYYLFEKREITYANGDIQSNIELSAQNVEDTIIYYLLNNSEDSSPDISVNEDTGIPDLSDWSITPLRPNTNNKYCWGLRVNTVNGGPVADQELTPYISNEYADVDAISYITIHKTAYCITANSYDIPSASVESWKDLENATNVIGVWMKNSPAGSVWFWKSSQEIAVDAAQYTNGIIDWTTAKFGEWSTPVLGNDNAALINEFNTLTANGENSGDYYAVSVYKDAEGNYSFESGDDESITTLIIANIHSEDIRNNTLYIQDDQRVDPSTEGAVALSNLCKYLRYYVNADMIQTGTLLVKDKNSKTELIKAGFNNGTAKIGRWNIDAHGALWTPNKEGTGAAVRLTGYTETEDDDFEPITSSENTDSVTKIQSVLLGNYRGRVEMTGTYTASQQVHTINNYSSATALPCKVAINDANIQEITAAQASYTYEYQAIDDISSSNLHSAFIQSFSDADKDKCQLIVNPIDDKTLLLLECTNMQYLNIPTYIPSDLTWTVQDLDCIDALYVNVAFKYKDTVYGYWYIISEQNSVEADSTISSPESIVEYDFRSTSDLEGGSEDFAWVTCEFAGWYPKKFISDKGFLTINEQVPDTFTYDNTEYSPHIWFPLDQTSNVEITDLRVIITSDFIGETGATLISNKQRYNATATSIDLSQSDDDKTVYNYTLPFSPVTFATINDLGEIVKGDPLQSYEVTILEHSISVNAIKQNIPTFQLLSDGSYKTPAGVLVYALNEDGEITNSVTILPDRIKFTKADETPQILTYDKVQQLLALIDSSNN